MPGETDPSLTQHRDAGKQQCESQKQDIEGDLRTDWEQLPSVRDKSDLVPTENKQCNLQL